MLASCSRSHLEKYGQLVEVFPARSEEPGVVHIQIVTTEIFPGRHVSFDPMVLKCPWSSLPAFLAASHVWACSFLEKKVELQD